MKRYSRISNKVTDRYAECDVCGFKFHIKDLKLVVDTYNRLYGKVVCKADFSPTNPQDRPLKIKEKIVSNTDIMRPRKPAIFVENENDDRVPGQVGDGWAQYDPLRGGIMLNWNAPVDNGSSAIIGYSILVSIPQSIFYVILIDNTNDPASYYLDTQTPINSQATYRVAAINSFGMGAYSNEIYWPYRYNYGISDGSKYLMTSPIHQFVITGLSQPIKIQL